MKMTLTIGGNMEKTPWFDGRINPVRSGAYETMFASSWGYSWWNGSWWSHQEPSVEAAKKFRRFKGHQRKEWRGLAKKP